MPRVRIKIPDRLVPSLMDVLPCGMTVSEFAYMAVVEKVNRQFGIDERARLRRLEGDLNALRPLVRALLEEVDHGCTNE